MVDAVVSFFIESVTEQLGQQAQLLYKVQEDITWIKGELQSIRAFLKDADRRREREEGVEAWIFQLRQEVFDAEDVIDAFMVQMEIEKHLRATRMMAYYVCIFKHMKAKRQFAAQIHTIRRKIDDIHKRGKKYGFQATLQQAIGPRTTESPYRDPGVAAPWVEEPDIVGLDDDAEKIQKWLLNDCDANQRTIISIVGMGGLGKTTLAKKAYKTIKMHFDCYSWVYVSQSFEKKDVLRKMLKGFYKSRKEAFPNDMEALPEEELREKIFNYLEEKRYALILDDIWDPSVWENVKISLPPEGGGRIILTTRIETLAFPVHERCLIHKLQPLSHELAWDLFCRKTFKNETVPGTCPEHLNMVGNDIVKRCGGLPLAIVAISGLMSRKRQNSTEWKEVLENLDWELSRNPDLQRLNQSLLTSYKHLPPQLKYCFLYCGMFPEDHVIKRKKLIHMWVAEGFVEEDPPKTQEETANHYFLQLIDRNMLQPIVHDRTGEIVSCQVHDLMHEIAICMFRKEEFALVLTHPNTSFEGRLRRLSIHSMGIPERFTELKLRSFLQFSLNELPSSSFWSRLSTLKLLRVLDLGGCKIASLPNEMVDLIHLRYLSLKNTNIKNLPTSIGQLHNLQTLDVRYSCLNSFPASIMKLSKLRHLLFVNNCPGYLKLPKGTPNFIKIQTLSGAAVDEDLSSELGSFTQLRKLRIGGVRGKYCPQLCSSISKLKYLLSLKIQTHDEGEELQLATLSQSPENLEKLYLRGMIKELPKWVSSLHCLRVIVFEGGQFSYDPLPTLGQLPNLAFVSLFKTHIGKKIGCPRGGFRQLRSMVIKSLEELEEWDAIGEDTMQSLQYLHIANCQKLRKLPNGLQCVRTLKKLYLEDMAEGFVESVKTGEDYKKVQHIPIVKQFSCIDGEYFFELLSKDQSQSVADKKSTQQPAPKSKTDTAYYSFQELSQVDGEGHFKLHSKNGSQSDAGEKTPHRPGSESEVE